MNDLVVLYEDAHCLAVVKPPGQFTQGTWAPPGEVTLETAVRQYLSPGEPASVYLGIAHRIDRPTSGLLVWAKTPKAARRLSAQFERRRVVKEYWAVLETSDLVDRLDRTPAIWVDWLTRADKNGIVHKASPHAAGAREAITKVHIPAVGIGTGRSRFAWARLWPETGRTHQLRAQAATRGMPIVGDVDYGASAPSALVHGIALHARSLSFLHPVSGVEMTLVAQAPSTWAQGGIAWPERELDEARATGGIPPDG